VPLLLQMDINRQKMELEAPMTHWVFRTGQKSYDLDTIEIDGVPAVHMDRDDVERRLVEFGVPIKKGDGRYNLIEAFVRWESHEIVNIELVCTA
jgi:hypothetical protein